MRYWVTGLAIVTLAGLPAVTGAQQSTTEKAGKKAESTAEKAKGATKDSWISSKTKIALYGDDRVAGSAINVDTKNAVVTLRGKVGSADEKKAAEEIAKTVDGVASVKNSL